MISRPLLVISALAALTGCGVSALQRPTAAFSQAASAAANDFAPELETPERLCRWETRFEHLQKRFDPNGHVAPLREGLLRPTVPGDPEDPPSQRCANVREAALPFLGALRAIEEYGQALELLAGITDYGGSGFGAAAHGASSALEKFNGPPLWKSALSGLAEPLTRLTNIILEEIAHHEIDRTVTAADDPLANVLTAFTAWNKATVSELDTVQRALANALASAELRWNEQQTRSAADLAAAIELHEFGARWTDRLALERRRQATFATVLEELRKSHHALKESFKPGIGGKQRHAELDAVIRHASNLLGELQLLHRLTTDND